MSYEISSTYISERYRQHLSAGMSHMQACSHIHPPPDASVMFRRSFELVKRCLVKNKHLAQLWSEPHEGFEIVWPDIKEASRHDSIVIPPQSTTDGTLTYPPPDTRGYIEGWAERGNKNSNA